jgi:hypothetical protein
MRVLVFTRVSGRGKESGLDLAQMRAEGTDVLRVRNGKVTTLVRYFDRDRALADLGLEAGKPKDAKDIYGESWIDRS